MRRILLAVCAAVAASTLVGILLGAYLHEVGVNTQRARHREPASVTTVSTTIRTVTVRVTPSQRAAHTTATLHPEPVLAGHDAPVARHSGKDTVPTPTTTSAAPTTSDRPSVTTPPDTTTARPTGVPCRIGHREAPPDCPPGDGLPGHPDPHSMPRP